MLARAEDEPNTDCAAPAAVEAIDYTTTADRQAYCADQWVAIRAEAQEQGCWYELREDPPEREMRRLCAAAEVEQRRRIAALSLVD